MSHSVRTRARSFGVLGLVLSIGLLLSACEPSAEQTNVDKVNAVRAAAGVAPLARSAELDAKAAAHAQVMASQGTIFHSSDLASGVSPGWRGIGENVAVAGSAVDAQAALEKSPGHYTNMVNGSYTEMGVGIVPSNGKVFVVQVFVGR